MQGSGHRISGLLVGVVLVACLQGCSQQGRVAGWRSGGEDAARRTVANRDSVGEGGDSVQVDERTLSTAPARVPTGFRVETLARGLSDVRMMAFSPDGRLFATQTEQGRVVVVPMGQGTPTAWATGRNQPHGIAFHQGYLYVADTNAVLRWPYHPGAARAPGAPQRIATLPSGAGHFTRTLGFGPDGKLYVSVGSSCNICIESNPHRAAILQMNPDGSGLRVYASGLRNAVGFTWDSQGRMWATDNGTDRMGDNFPPEELDLIREGAFYGWPFAHGNRVPDPRYGSGHRDMVARTTPPSFTFTAHSAPLGLAFYYGNQFPAQYHGDLFVALHGSWNRSTPSGFKVVRVHFENGVPKSVTDFVTGFGLGNSAWARPVGVIAASDGSLLITDDKGGRIFRVRHVGR